MTSSASRMPRLSIQRIPYSRSVANHCWTSSSTMRRRTESGMDGRWDLRPVVLRGPHLHRPARDRIGVVLGMNSDGRVFMEFLGFIEAGFTLNFRGFCSMLWAFAKPVESPCADRLSRATPWRSWSMESREDRECAGPAPLLLANGKGKSHSRQSTHCRFEGGAERGRGR